MIARLLILFGLTLPLVTRPISANVVEFNVGSVDDLSNFGNGASGIIDMPTFDPRLGTLTDTVYSATFVTILSGPPNVGFTGTLFPELDLCTASASYPCDGSSPPTGLAIITADIPVSGASDSSGDAFVTGNGSADGEGLVGPPATIPVQWRLPLLVGFVEPPGEWFSAFNEADITVQYFYTPVAVPEPTMLGLIALMLLAIIFAGCRGRHIEGAKN